MGKCYKKTFLKKVVVRVDFASTAESLVKKPAPNVSALLLKAFPILEPRKTIAAKLMIGGKQLEEQEKEVGTHWFYHGKDRKRRAVVAPEHFLVEYDVYKSYDELKSHFLPILEQLFKSVNELQARRFGLRYINHITIAENNVFDWSDYLNDLIRLPIEMAQDKTEIVRAFNIFSISDGDMILQSQYGMYNPDFPAPIKNKLFILDFDAYTEGLLDFEQVQSRLDKFHDAIESLFESLITDKLRDIMGVIDAD